MNLQEIILNNDITLGTATFRLVLSFLAGSFIGIEREAHNQPAGMRTHILIAVGSTLAMLVSIYLPQIFPDFQNGDPARIAAQVVSGIGFLGAGAILRFGINVRGLTTAASVWAIAMIGLAIGVGMYIISLIALVLVLFALIIMDLFEKKFFRSRIFKRIEFNLVKNSYNFSEIETVLKGINARIHSVDFVKQDSVTHDRIVYYAYILEKMDVKSLSTNIESISGLSGYSIEMIN